MPWGSVYVKGPDDEDIYINGNYEKPAGKTNTTYSVEYGCNTFETLDKSGNIVLRATTNVDENNLRPTVLLRTVSSNVSGDGS